MEVVNIVKSVYLIPGSNFVFNSLGVLVKYLELKYGMKLTKLIPADDPEAPSRTVISSGDFTEGATVVTLIYGNKEISAVERKVVTDENVDAVFASGW